MGSQSKYNTKDLVYVNALIGEAPQGGGDPPSVKYGFFTNIPATNRTALGHVAIPAASFGDPPVGLVLGCSFPKPNRAAKRETNRFTSSFVSKEKIISAKIAGYRISKTKARTKLILTADDKFVKSVYVKIRGIKYAWNIPKVTESNIQGGLTALGIVDAVAADKDDLCFGANFPKPPRAQQVAGDETNGIKTMTTFYDPTKTAVANWELLGGGKLNLL